MATDNKTVYTTTAASGDNSWQNVYSQTSVAAAEFTKSDQWYQTTVAPSAPVDTGPVYQTTNAPVIPDATTSIPSMYQTTISSSSYQTVYSNDQPAQSYQYQPSSITTTVANKVDNVYQSSGAGSIVVNAKRDKTDKSLGYLGGAISESKTEVQFPEDEQPLDSYSYYGALKPKGSNFVPLNTSNQSGDKMIDRMLYTPPPLPPNFEFSYYGALRSKGANFVPLNSSNRSAADPEKVLNDEVYQNSLQPNNQEPDVPNQIDFTTPAVSLKNQYKYNNTPIDVYSQYGALRNKNG